jgi:hypothetical protein
MPKYKKDINSLQFQIADYLERSNETDARKLQVMTILYSNAVANLSNDKQLEIIRYARTMLNPK